MQCLNFTCSFFISSSTLSRHKRNLCLILLEYFVFSFFQQPDRPLTISMKRSKTESGAVFSNFSSIFSTVRSNFIIRIVFIFCISNLTDCTYFILIWIIPPLKNFLSTMKWIALDATVDFPIPCKPRSVTNLLPLMIDSTSCETARSLVLRVHEIWAVIPLLTFMCSELHES